MRRGKGKGRIAEQSNGATKTNDAELSSFPSVRSEPAAVLQLHLPDATGLEEASKDVPGRRQDHASQHVSKTYLDSEVETHVAHQGVVTQFSTLDSRARFRRHAPGTPTVTMGQTRKRLLNPTLLQRRPLPRAPQPRVADSAKMRCWASKRIENQRAEGALERRATARSHEGRQ